jgi:hypothetical protein
VAKAKAASAAAAASKSPKKGKSPAKRKAKVDPDADDDNGGGGGGAEELAGERAVDAAREAGFAEMAARHAREHIGSPRKLTKAKRAKVAKDTAKTAVSKEASLSAMLVDAGIDS